MNKGIFTFIIICKMKAKHLFIYIYTGDDAIYVLSRRNEENRIDKCVEKYTIVLNLIITIK